jgi:hypothetical protein
MSEENTKKGNGFYLITVFALLIALAYVTYMWSSKRAALNACTNENLVLKSDMDGMNKMMEGYVGTLSNDLKTDFKNMLNTYDKLIEKDQSKADSLNVQKEKIQGLLNDLNANKRLTASQLFQLKKENETLRDIMKGYVKQIDALNTLNIELTSKLDETSTQLNSTTVERDDYKKEVEEKDLQLKKGAKLAATAMNSVALDSKWNKNMKKTDKAKNTVQIMSSFTISPNTIATAEKKSIYLQITAPDGRILQARSNNTVDTEQGNVAYSDKKDIDYQNQAVDVTIYYDFKTDKAIKGNYKLKVICDGVVIGSDSFTLK